MFPRFLNRLKNPKYSNLCLNFIDKEFSLLTFIFQYVVENLNKNCG